MTKMSRRGLAAVVVLAYAGAVQAQQALAQFPVLAPGQTEYVVTQDQANGLIIDTLYLPKGVTLRPGPGVRSINWSVRVLKIDEGATIDLSAPQAKPPKAANGAAPPRQAGYCTPGVAGAAGAGGTAGAQGVSLTLRDIETLENMGSLWIRTDGGPGGDGGDGGRGQQGGGPRRNRLSDRCGAAAGGSGGAGGAAGPGGEVANVAFVFRDNNRPTGIPNGVADSCGRSQRPAVAHGKAGVIAIWGTKGCPGQRGADGAAGGRG